MIIPTSPNKLVGNWKDGYALDTHTIKSVLIGEDEFGHLRYDTERSQLGEAVYQLKYKSDMAKVKDISETVCDFISNKWKDLERLDFVVPVPPSKTRVMQPVLEVAKQISNSLKIPLSEADLVKGKNTSQLKNIYNYEERIKILEDVFIAGTTNLQGKNILLFDDLYQSGATLKVITDVLYNQIEANVVYVLTLTQTRKSL